MGCGNSGISSNSLNVNCSGSSSKCSSTSGSTNTNSKIHHGHNRVFPSNSPTEGSNQTAQVPSVEAAYDSASDGKSHKPSLNVIKLPPIQQAARTCLVGRPEHLQKQQQQVLQPQEESLRQTKPANLAVTQPASKSNNPALQTVNHSPSQTANQSSSSQPARSPQLSPTHASKQATKQSKLSSLLVPLSTTCDPVSSAIQYGDNESVKSSEKVLDADSSIFTLTSREIALHNAAVSRDRSVWVPYHGKIYDFRALYDSLMSSHKKHSITSKHSKHTNIVRLLTSTFTKSQIEGALKDFYVADRKTLSPDEWKQEFQKELEHIRRALHENTFFHDEYDAKWTLNYLANVFVRGQKEMNWVPPRIVGDGNKAVFIQRYSDKRINSLQVREFLFGWQPFETSLQNCAWKSFKVENVASWPEREKPQMMLSPPKLLQRRKRLRTYFKNKYNIPEERLKLWDKWLQSMIEAEVEFQQLVETDEDSQRKTVHNCEDDCHVSVSDLDRDNQIKSPTSDVGSDSDSDSPFDDISSMGEFVYMRLPTIPE